MKERSLETPSKGKVRVFVVVAALLAASLLAAVMGVRPAKAAFPGQNGKIAFVSDRSGSDEIYRMNADGSDQIQLTNTVGTNGWPAWSPSGQKIAFMSDRIPGNWEVFLMNANGTQQKNLTNHPAYDGYPAWGPPPMFNFSGTSRVVFYSDRTGGGDLYKTYFDSGGNVTGTTRLTKSLFSDSNPAVSPDATKIAFVSDRDGDDDIYVMKNSPELRTTNVPVKLTNNSMIDSDPDWSPNGKKIAFTNFHNGSFEVFVMNSDGTNKTNITQNAALDFDPAFSPDGKKIAFVSSRSGNWEVFVMNSDGSNPTNLTKNAAHDRDPSWQPIP